MYSLGILLGYFCKNKFQYPLDSEINTLQVFVSSFPLFPDTVEVKWVLTGDNVIREGFITIPHEVVLDWGTDDSVIEDYVLLQLNLTRQ